MPVKLESILLSSLMVLSVGACAKKAARGSEAPSAEAQAQAMEHGDPLAQLQALEGRMRNLGLPVAAAKRSVERKDAGAGEPAADMTSGDMAEDMAGADGAAVEFSEEAEPAEAPMPAPTGSARDEQVDYCSDLCSLSESICGLEVRICELAEDHGNDPVYDDACERAIEDCEIAGQACDGCGE